jgi:hypothetical protein
MEKANTVFLLLEALAQEGSLPQVQDCLCLLLLPHQQLADCHRVRQNVQALLPTHFLVLTLQPSHVLRVSVLSGRNLSKPSLKAVVCSGVGSGGRRGSTIILSLSPIDRLILHGRRLLGAFPDEGSN